MKDYKNSVHKRLKPIYQKNLIKALDLELFEPEDLENLIEHLNYHSSLRNFLTINERLSVVSEFIGHELNINSGMVFTNKNVFDIVKDYYKDFPKNMQHVHSLDVISSIHKLAVYIMPTCEEDNEIIDLLYSIDDVEIYINSRYVQVDPRLFMHIKGNIYKI